MPLGWKMSIDKVTSTFSLLSPPKGFPLLAPRVSSIVNVPTISGD